MTTSTTPTTPDLSTWLERHKRLAGTRPRPSRRQAQADSTPQPLAEDAEAPVATFRPGGTFRRPPGKLCRIHWRVLEPWMQDRILQIIAQRLGDGSPAEQ